MDMTIFWKCLLIVFPVLGVISLGLAIFDLKKRGFETDKLKQWWIAVGCSLIGWHHSWRAISPLWTYKRNSDLWLIEALFYLACVLFALIDFINDMRMHGK